MKRITLTVGLDVGDDARTNDVIHEVTDAIAENVTLADELRYTSDGVHIAAMDEHKIAKLASARVRDYLRNVSDCRHSDRGHGLVCMACVEVAIDYIWQNAVDAGQNATMEETRRALERAVQAGWDLRVRWTENDGHVGNIGQFFHHNRREIVDRLMANPSPAKDPIADAVHADLAPLASDLIDAGHKLVKDVPAEKFFDLCPRCTKPFECSGDHIVGSSFCPECSKLSAYFTPEVPR